MDGGVTGTPPAAPAPTEDGSGAPSGRSEPVEEADIYRFEGNRLFSLNTYRGLVIYDLSDPAKPRQLSQVLHAAAPPSEQAVRRATPHAAARRRYR